MNEGLSCIRTRGSPKCNCSVSFPMIWTSTGLQRYSGSEDVCGKGK